MQLNPAISLALLAHLCAAAFAAEAAERPDVAKAKPLARCKLQELGVRKSERSEAFSAMMYASRTAEDSLANYERTPLGDWPMLANTDRTDPWLRLLLLSRRRPVVIDVAI